MTPEVFRNILLRLVLVPVAVLGATVAVLLLQINSLRNSALWVDHTDVAISYSGQLMSRLIEQESSLRGYLLSGSPQFLEEYNQTAKEVPPALDRLQAFTADNPQQQQSISQLRQAYKTWSQSAAEALAAGPPNGQIVPGANLRTQEMSQLRHLNGQIILREEQLRSQRIAGTLSLLQDTFIVLGAVGLIAAILIAWAALHQMRTLSAAYDRRIAEVRRQGEWFNTTLFSIGDGVIACDEQGHVVFMNGVAGQLTGWAAADAQGKPISEIFQILDERTRATAPNPIEIVRSTGKSAAMAHGSILIRRDRTEIPIADTAAPISKQDGEFTGAVLVFRDVTEQQRASEALRNAEKVAVAARLAASIAHEINNPLEALTNLLFLAAGSKSLEETREFIDVAQEQLQRASVIVAQTLDFYRGAPTQSECAIPDLLDSVLSTWQRRFSARHIRIQRDYAATPPMTAYVSELRQMIANLVANAYESMNSHGRMIIRARTVESGQRIRITIADTGSGIEPALSKKIFEPFFTTKSTGTGLGLWLTSEIVRKHGGKVRIRSRKTLPSGTVVSVSLPIPSSGVQPTTTLEHALQI